MRIARFAILIWLAVATGMFALGAVRMAVTADCFHAQDEIYCSHFVFGEGVGEEEENPTLTENLTVLAVLAGIAATIFLPIWAAAYFAARAGRRWLNS